MIEPTDENTGLPPLNEPLEGDTIWAMVFTGGQADVLSPVDRSPQGCMVLSVRGLINGRSEGGRTAGPDWAQIHVAIPHGAVRQLRDEADAYLHLFPEEGP